MSFLRFKRSPNRTPVEEMIDDLKKEISVLEQDKLIADGLVISLKQQEKNTDVDDHIQLVKENGLMGRLKKYGIQSIVDGVYYSNSLEKEYYSQFSSDDMALDRKRNLEKLGQAKEKYRQMIQSLPEMIQKKIDEKKESLNIYWIPQRVMDEN